MIFVLTIIFVTVTLKKERNYVKKTYYCRKLENESYFSAEAKEVFEGVKNFVKDYTAVELPTVVIAPVFTSISAVEAVKCDCGCGGNKISIAGQNCHWEKSGAYTGEISVEMLKDAGCDYVIIGHSERRQYFSETDEMINKKAKAILAGGLIPIICCGETLEQREAGVTDSWIAGQIKAALRRYFIRRCCKISYRL